MFGIKDRLSHGEMRASLHFRIKPAQFFIQIFGQRIDRHPDQ